MPKPTRPDPDALLASIQQDEAKAQRGRLKIFLGMAPGVGKTYAMLREAHQRYREGVDVVVGLVETHGRTETKAMVEGLVMAPRRIEEYRGVKLEELDLDGILFLEPKLVLVDELAHTNAPNSRHPKRYQDVEELLSQGIDVYTTLNVQHVESRADTVRQITGASVSETVPDSILELADEVQVIDLSPNDLRERLAEGKVYLGPRADAAAQNFFKPENLTALRELALRLTAERVDQQLSRIREGKLSRSVWKSGGRLMVAVGPSPFSLNLVRWTRRMAYALNAPWIAVCVRTHRGLSPEAQYQLDHNLTIARELGAEVILTHNENIADALVDIALQYNVTQIVAGKPRTSPLFDLLLGGSLVDQLIRRSGEIDIYVVPAESAKPQGSWRPLRSLLYSENKEYTQAICTIAAITLLGWFIAPFTGYWTIALFYLLGVVLLALFIGRVPIFLAAVLSALTWDFLFIPPLFTFYINKFEDGFMCVVFFVVALVTGQLTSRIRTQEKNERRREQRAQALYRLSRDLATATTADEIFSRSRKQIRELFSSDTAFLLPNSQFGLSQTAHASSTFQPDEKELGVATWSYRNKQQAGRFTETLPSATAFHLPLMTKDAVLGILAVQPVAGKTLSFDQRELLETFAQQISLVLEKEKLRSHSAQAQLLAKSDQLHRTLLNSISHELKTPLSVIQSALEGISPGEVSSRSQALLEESHAALDRLKRLVRNLLDGARLESDQFAPKKEWGEVRDLVQQAITLAKPALNEKRLQLEIPGQLPLLHADFGLLEEALGNLLHNAAVHTPENTAITLKVEPSTDAIIIRVMDQGKGIPADLLPHLFKKFHRASDARPGGTGLGLSIARGFVEAHGGTLEAYNASDQKGAVFVIRLPLEKQPEAATLKL